MISLLLLGFLIGMRHALEADHVAAVATLTTRTATVKQAVKLGSIWGIGHTLTLFLFGSIVLLTDLFIPETMAKWLELGVGIMLVLLGIDVLRRLLKERIHYHAHQHKDEQNKEAHAKESQHHFHAHSHAEKKNNKEVNQSSHEHQHPDNLSYRALFIGVLHGMAGSAALILLTLETIHSPLQGMIYIALFGIGSVAGMAALSYIISIPLRASALGMTWMHNGLQLLIGSATVILGVSVVMNNAQ